ncbi:ABC transporter substrate-binding protein [Amorphus orientalis]|uniref:Branched-chain amino acid transport system substrate-binding protein n=1 Tax=Amorphus orientalis TaxID=649198 RepID=A0AAE4AV91_9HYPH|nr:ABC transporter substrate-binding protein [Amorphus orientalis]MDQ0316454.1 branched-chain amino acid transport system substrate-binding protein [Amorphus orientalis]
MYLRFAAAGALALAFTLPASAEINVCVTVSATGPAASLGVPENNTVPLLPTEFSGQKVNYIVFDDATDPTAAVKNVRKCIEEENADVIIGSSATPGSMAVAGIAAETKTPVIPLAPISLEGDAGHWAFPAPQPNVQMASALVDHMKTNGVKTLGFLGYSDAFGEQFLNATKKQLEGTDIELGPVERFARTDTSVTGQALKLVSANPDAILVVASGTPSALPNLTLAERGYKGQMYHTHGSASDAFLRVAQDAAEGTILPVGPVVVAAQLPDDHPSKELAVQYTKDYEAANGEGSLSSFGGHMFDAGQMIQAATEKALATGAEPGTPEFRSALRDALANMEEVVGVHGVFNTSDDNHYGHDERSRVLVQVDGGTWKYIGQ